VTRPSTPHVHVAALGWAAAALTVGIGAQAQQAPPTPVIAGVKVGGSVNVHLLSHLQLGRAFTSANLEVEQELSRPYVYTSVMLEPTGTNIISLKDPTKPTIIYAWRMPGWELREGLGAVDNKYFKLKGRYYDVQALQFWQGGPQTDIGAHVIDVTGLPDTSKIIDKGFMRAPPVARFHNIFAYKHSDGRVLLFTTTAGEYATIYDMERFLGGDPQQGLIGQMLGSPPFSPVGVDNGGIPTNLAGFHDFYIGYDPVTHQDKFYGAAWSGYSIYDVTRPEDPKLLTSVTGAAGVQFAHTFTPDPTGRYAVTETEYQYAPLRIFDLKPGLDGTVKTISRPIGAWNADWQDLVHTHEVRWPYVFVSGYEDGLQIFNMMDPTNPYTVGYYYTCHCPHNRGFGGTTKNPEGPPSVLNGARGVDVRNADGMIVISDSRTGFWAFHMDGFDGWNGHEWGLPNISSAQDWDNGPEGAPKPQKAALR
jgi:hypothetical protein